MKKTKSESIKIITAKGEVSGILDAPAEPFAGLALAHGAGAGMRHPFMNALSLALVSRGFAVLRYQFPYMEAGKKRTDTPAVAIRTVEAAATELRKRFSKLPLLAAGKSFGGRMTTTAAAEGLLLDISGLICFGFPLHPSGKPSIKRAAHLAQVPVPILFLQGTRDGLADLKLLRPVCAKLPGASLQVIEGADHSFGILKRSGRTAQEVMEELAEESLRFAISLAGKTSK